MQVSHLKIIGVFLFVGALVGTSAAFIVLQKVSENNQATLEALPNSEQEAEVEIDPKYLAYVPSIEAGISYRVKNSDHSELAVIDEDHELVNEEADDRGADDELSPEQQAERDAAAAKAELKGFVGPGIYVTDFGLDSCEYELWRVLEDNKEHLIGQDEIRSGRLIVNLNVVEPDRFYSSPECGDWSEWTPLAEPLETAGNGDYWIGDLKKGTWSVPRGCIWERVSDFRGANLLDVKQSGLGPTEIAIDDEELGLRVRGCRSDLTFVSEQIDDDLRFVEVVDDNDSRVGRELGRRR